MQPRAASPDDSGVLTGGIVLDSEDDDSDSSGGGNEADEGVVRTTPDPAGKGSSPLAALAELSLNTTNPPTGAASSQPTRTDRALCVPGVKRKKKTREERLQEAKAKAKLAVDRARVNILSSMGGD